MYVVNVSIYGSRGLCRQVRLAPRKRGDQVVTVVPESLIDDSLLQVAGGGKKRKPAGAFGGTRLKKCHWQDISKWRPHPTGTYYLSSTLHTQNAQRSFSSSSWTDMVPRLAIAD